MATPWGPPFQGYPEAMQDNVKKKLGGKGVLGLGWITTNGFRLPIKVEDQVVIPALAIIILVGYL